MIFDTKAALSSSKKDIKESANIQKYIFNDYMENTFS